MHDEPKRLTEFIGVCSSSDPVIDMVLWMECLHPFRTGSAHFFAVEFGDYHSLHIGPGFSETPNFGEITTQTAVPRPAFLLLLELCHAVLTKARTARIAAR